MTGIYIDGVEAEPAELTARGIFDYLEHCIHEDILLEIEDPAAITAEVSKLLIWLNHEDIFVVRRLAKDFAKAIAREHAFKDGDMLEVVRKQSAILEPMIAWLERHGVNCRSLRPPFRTKNVGL
jgi:hypothetical protein